MIWVDGAVPTRSTASAGECDPGMKGCVLHGRVAFSKDSKNSPRIRRQQAAREQGPAGSDNR
ncbi:MAG: hypothetical protein ABEJ96_06840 [Thiohalorhabdaceae bacterium]